MTAFVDRAKHGFRIVVKGIYMKRFQIIMLSLVVLSLSACKNLWWWNNDDDDSNNPYKGVPAKQLYTDAKAAIAKKEYATAAKRLEALESMYPFNDYAEDAQLKLIYAYYQNGDYASSAATAEHYIHLYPRARHVDYAYYMKGLANFEQPRGTLTNVLPMDESWRDPGTQQQAYADFSTLISRFPESRYKANALQRMIYLRNMFAQHELNISKYYYERKMYVASAERASYLVKNYPQAPSAQEALVMIYRANMQLGLAEAAHDAVKVYENTYHSKPVLDA